MQRKYVFLFFSILSCSMIYAQEIENNSSHVSEPLTALKNIASTTIAIDTFKLYHVRKVALQNNALPQVKIKNIEKHSLNETSNFKKFPTSLEPLVSLSMERKKPIAYIYFPHYYINNGQLEEITNFDFDIEEGIACQNKNAGNRVYTNNSVLASGTFYKISVAEQGVFRLDYNYLKNIMGLNPENINPNTIKIYGNGGTVLPEGNNIIPIDDLFENAITVVGAEDGQFNTGDYILFYANGPHTIIQDAVNKNTTHKYNVYENDAYYFLTFGGANGKRINSQNNSNSETHTVASPNFFYFYEKDSVNIGKGGKLWWDTEFSTLPGRSLKRSYSIPFSNIDNNFPIKLSCHVGAVSYSGTNYFNINANGQNIAQQTINALAGTDYYFPYIENALLSQNFNINSSSLNLELLFNQGSSSAVGYIDYFELLGNQNLQSQAYTRFFDWASVGTGNVAKYQIANASAQTRVWDISNALEPVAMQINLSGGQGSFKQNADFLHEFVLFDGSAFKTPNYLGIAPNQNLHALKDIDYIIISHPDFISQANQLADYHLQKRGFSAAVVTPSQIYNEFSSGSQDVSAIRNFIKMLYDKAPANRLPNSVLLLGDASYAFKNLIANNTNLVPTYQSDQGIIKTLTYCTDDFFSFLDDNEDFNNFSAGFINTCDIGVGRIMCQTAGEAQDVINKIMAYDSPKSFGPWKNNIFFNADDEDSNYHLHDAENMSNYVGLNYQNFNQYKLYIDALEQISTPAGQRTPDANKIFRSRVFQGQFIVNYNGHGGPLGWCQERILTTSDIATLNNENKLPLFITATCDFTQYDNPDLHSAGELLMMKKDGGAIALFTTTRLVFVPGNAIMNVNIYKKCLPENLNISKTLGDIYRESKNVAYASGVVQEDAVNFRKFALIGDPALPLAYPKYKVVVDSINGHDFYSYADTLKALGKYTVKGHLVDLSGNPLTNFNGTVNTTLFDKAKKFTTLANDPKSYKEDFYLQNNILFNGKSSVNNGYFSTTFVMPKDINYAVDSGKFSFYAYNESIDATGYAKPLIGSSIQGQISDNKGPDILPFLNDFKFVSGGITKSNSLLLIKLHDENGINYTGNSVGHDITAVLDDNAQNYYILNTFYEGEKDDYTSGLVTFPLEDISEGNHFLRIKAWDILNNSSEVRMDFIVVNSGEGHLEHLYNYPNPFSTNTQFMFEHNLPNENLYINLKILSMSGKVVKEINEVVNTTGTRYDGIYWDGKDEMGDKLGNGVYLYQLSLKSQNGFKVKKTQKLMIIR